MQNDVLYFSVKIKLMRRLENLKNLNKRFRQFWKKCFRFGPGKSFFRKFWVKICARPKRIIIINSDVQLQRLKNYDAGEVMLICTCARGSRLKRGSYDISLNDTSLSDGWPSKVWILIKFWLNSDSLKSGVAPPPRIQGEVLGKGSIG